MNIIFCVILSTRKDYTTKCNNHTTFELDWIRTQEDASASFQTLYIQMTFKSGLSHQK